MASLLTFSQDHRRDVDNSWTCAELARFSAVFSHSTWPLNWVPVATKCGGNVLAIIPFVHWADIACFIAHPSPRRSIAMQFIVETTARCVVATFFGASRLINPVGILTGSCRCPDRAVERVFIPARILRNAVVRSIYLLPITLTNIYENK